jgi:hypothetical protein
MAFREVTMLEVKEILRLWLSGVPKVKSRLLCKTDSR